jgi:hypothetical protein
MSKHYSNREVSFDIEFRPADKASVHGGQLGVRALMKEFGLQKRVAREPALDPRKQTGKGYDPMVYIEQILLTLTSGGASLADAERLNDDQALKALLGIERFPDQTSLGEWLRNVGTEGWQALRRINRDLARWILDRAQPGRYEHAGRLECFFDDTQIEVSGPSFEGARLNYEGNLALSWQTLFVGPLLVDSVLGATSDTKESPSSQEAGKDVSSQLPHLLEQNQDLWKGRDNHLYTDSASSAGKYLETIHSHFKGWSVSYNKWTGPLETQAGQLPACAWSAEEKIKWRDGSEHRGQYGWLRHQPGGCEHPQLFAVLKHQKPGELFWQYAFVTCQEQDRPPKMVFEHHRLKGDWERLLSELLRDLDLHHLPCQALGANRVFYGLATLAYNFLQALKLIYLPAEHQPKRVRTLLHQLLLIPIELKRHAHRLKACLYIPAGWVVWWRGFLGDLLPACRQLSRVALSPPVG